jgi:hypothetical protein
MNPRKPNSITTFAYDLFNKAWPLVYTALCGLVYDMLKRVSLPAMDALYAFWFLMAAGLVAKATSTKMLRAFLETVLNNWPKA